MKLNILYVITKLELGGAQKQLLALMEALDKNKFNVFLFTAEKGLLVDDVLLLKGIKIKRSVFLERPINFFKDIIAFFEIYAFIKKNKIEIVHTHSSKAGILGRWAGKLAKAKVIIHTVHGWSFNDYQHRLKRVFFIWVERITAKFTDTIVIVSDYDREKGLANRIGREKSYRLIRYGINYAEFQVKDKDIKKELGINNGDLIVGTVCCLKAQKSPRDFIKLAFLVNKFLPHTKFILVGDGVLRKEVEGEISRLNLQNQVILTGWRRDIPRILSAMDVFVLTSLWEGLPIAVLEAIAAGKVVVATDTGGVREIIACGKTGFLVPLGDITALSEKIIMLFKNKNVGSQTEESIKDIINRGFTIEDMARQNQSLYEFYSGGINFKN